MASRIRPIQHRDWPTADQVKAPIPVSSLDQHGMNFPKAEKATMTNKSTHDSNLHEQSIRDIDGDAALAIVGAQDAQIEVDEQDSRRLRRKIDAIIMPFLCLAYGLNYLDKTALSYASITGMQQSINLVGDNYQWLGSLFYIGYLGFEPAAARLIQYLPLAKFSASCFIAWGITTACLASVQNFAGAAAVRLLLGMLEASTSPACVLFISQWYRREEQGIRSAWLVSFNGLAQIFGGLVAYGFAHGSESHQYTIAPWRAIFLFLGLLAIVVGVAFIVVVPDSQLNAWWLTREERLRAVERVRINQQGIGNSHFKAYQLREALMDPAVWALFVVSLVGYIPNGGLTNFFSLLIKSFGYSTDYSLLYGCISGAIEVVALLTWAYMTRRHGYRLLGGILGLLIALLGSILLVALPPSAIHGRLAGFFLAQLFATGLITAITILSSNVAGYTKKTVVAGGFFMCYSAGNIIGPQTFRPQDAPNYRPAEITLIVCYGICVLDLTFLHFWYQRENRRKDSMAQQSGIPPGTSRAFLDLTDRENPDFRYTL